MNNNKLFNFIWIVPVESEGAQRLQEWEEIELVPGHNHKGLEYIQTEREA